MIKLHYGLCSSRSRENWKNIPHVVLLAPEKWKLKQELRDEEAFEDFTYYDISMSAKAK